MVNQPKKHHYLPQFYLRNFANNEGKLWIFDRENKEYRHQTPPNVAVQGDYYTIRDQQGIKDYGLEQMLSLVETDTKPVIDAVVNHELLNSAQKETIAIFAAWQMLRVPEYEKATNELSAKFTKTRMQARFYTTESAERFIKEYEQREGKKIKFSAQELHDYINSDRYTIEFEREHSISHMLWMAIRLAPLFLNLDYFFLYAPHNSSFITSDNPFVLLPPAGYKPDFYGYGLLTEDSEKVLPLHPSVCLVMVNPGERMLGSAADRKTVRHLNRAIARKSDRFVLARDKALLQRVVKISKADQGRRTQRVQFYSPFDHEDKEEKSILGP